MYVLELVVKHIKLLNNLSIIINLCIVSFTHSHFTSLFLSFDRLKPVFDIPLHVPIQTVVVTPGNTHLLAPLRDGRLAVVAVHLPVGIKKHSVLNV